MLIRIPRVLQPDQLAECRRALGEAAWIDGRVTAGSQSGQVKNNMQVPEDHPAARQIGQLIVAALERHPLFVSAALPLKIFPPLFNRYSSGQNFGAHVDNAIRQVRGTGHRVRTDLSATLFFHPPEQYEGGELVVEDTYGAHSVKLPAGDMVLYPSGSLHHVRPVTSGERLCAFFWIQSMVRDDGERRLLFELDSAIQKVRQEQSESPAAVELTAVYHNLLRRWADT